MAYKIVDAQGNQLASNYTSIRGARTAKTRLANQGKAVYQTARILDEAGRDVDAPNPIEAPEAE